MARRGRRAWGALFLVFLLGGVVGQVLAESVRNLPGLSFLARTVEIGLEPPLRLDLSFFSLTFGTILRLNLAILIGVILALWVWRLV
ncbi:MAG: DUF4321 domain-containing protein [Armatimonadota bacterium]|nr:DUF4321 domain-containing protein [Armatimonadota bacterium]MDR7439162.1 DUF4321 domain-containing protein [Armatimonadota bacterium]MDR7563027.1 DUF4321 domain-containing protein [Armatimonadota bacterium]MDR7567678.1 DUF4321 domain-containing protein [Armatimonadota bacterium]MDR7600871.1 DUF4321 domain-containing protein [Armatimonadota bacterium]